MISYSKINIQKIMREFFQQGYNKNNNNDNSKKMHENMFFF
jgi:hypothetical protein